MDPARQLRMCSVAAEIQVILGRLTKPLSSTKRRRVASPSRMPRGAKAPAAVSPSGSIE